MKIASEKEKQKALVTQLQFQKVVLQAVAPTKEHFQQGKSVSGKRIIFSVAQLTKHLTEVLELNQFHEAEPETESGLTYQSSDERVKSLSEEKAKLVKKLRDTRQKVLINKSKAMLPQFQDNQFLPVKNRVMHDGARPPLKWVVSAWAFFFKMAAFGRAKASGCISGRILGQTGRF